MYKWTMFSLFVVACSLAVIYSVASMEFGSSEGGSAEKAVATVIEKDSEGAEIYAKATCVSCHGADLKGMSSAGIPTLLGVGDKYSKDELVGVIKNGIRGMGAQYDANIAKGLTDDDLDKLAEWLSIQKVAAAAETTSH